MFAVPFVLLALKSEVGRMTYKVTPGLALTMVRVAMFGNMGLDIYMEFVKKA